MGETVGMTSLRIIFGEGVTADVIGAPTVILNRGRSWRRVPEDHETSPRWLHKTVLFRLFGVVGGGPGAGPPLGL